MNEAMAWMKERSGSTGEVRQVLMEIGRCAQGCVATRSPADIIRKLALSRSTFYWCMSSLKRLGEIETAKYKFGHFRPRIYHLQAFCRSTQKECAQWAFFTGQPKFTVSSGNPLTPSLPQVRPLSSDPRTVCPVENSSSGKLQRQRSFLFPDLLTKDQARDLCEDCGGTGWRTVSYPNEDGREVQGAVVCTHSLARLTGRWSLGMSSSEERFANKEMAQWLADLPRPGPRRAVQLRLKASA